MKKTLLLLLACHSLLGQTKSDDYEVVFGPFFKVSSRAVPVEFIGYDHTGFYLTYARGRTGAGELSLAKFGYDLRLKEELELSQRIGKEEALSIQPFMIGNKLYHFLSTTSFSEKKIYLQEISPSMSLEEERLVTTISGRRNAYGVDLDVRFAPDSAYVAVVYTIPNKRKDNQKFGVHVFDRNMDEQWQQLFELPYENQLLELQSFQIDQKGDVYVLGRRFKNKRKARVKGTTNYDYLLFDMQKDGAIDSTVIATEGKFLKNMNIAITDGGDVISAGFYSDELSSSIGGAYYMRMNRRTKEVLSSSFKAFGVDFLTQNMKEKEAGRTRKRIAEGKGYELPFYHIDAFVTDKSGRTKIIGERRHIYETYIQGVNGVVTSSINYDYQDIIVVDIDPQGEINWSTRIAKNQHTVNDAAVYSSYSLAPRKGELYFIFNDNAKNLYYSGTGRVASMQKGRETMVMLNRVDKNGKMQRSALFNRAEIGTKIRPALSKLLNDDEMLLFGHKGLKTQRFILLKFN